MSAILAFTTVVLALGYLVRLGRVVRADRSTSTPRSHPEQVGSAGW